MDFASGDTEKSFIFVAVQDAVYENLEEVTLGFGTLPAGVSTKSPAQGSVAIWESIHLSFEESTYEAYEGGTGSAVTVKLDGPAATEIVIPITAAGMNGATNDDWTGVPNSLTFSAGDTQKSFTVMAYDDDVEDNGERVELGFGTLPPGVAPGNPSIANVELMNTEEESLNCGTSIWCATETPGQYNPNNRKRGGTYHKDMDDATLIGDPYFTYNGTRYDVTLIYSSLSHDYPYLSRLVIKFNVNMPTVDDYSSWEMQVDNVDFPFTPERLVGGGFRWRHPMFFDFRLGTTTELRIEEATNRQPRATNIPPPAPMYLTIFELDSRIDVAWERPPMDWGPDVLFDTETSVPEVTGYRVEWKKASDKWADTQSSSFEVLNTRRPILNLTNGVQYTVRVYAFNQYGESPPSPEVTDTPQ